MKKDESYWKKNLTGEQYEIMRKKGTESPFSGRLLHNKKDGEYICSACKTVLFPSDAKFDSGTGWPSFTDAKNIELKEDLSHGMIRTEVVCRNCKSHLGHVFDDGPNGKKRYCINSVCLDFREEKK